MTNIRRACSPVFKGTGSRDKDGTDKPCARQIADCVYWRSVCVYLTGLRSPWLWELRPALVRYCRNWWVTHIPSHVSIQRHAEKCGTMWEDVFTCTSDYAQRALLKRLLIWVRCTWMAAGPCWQKCRLTLSALMLWTICEELWCKCDVWAGCAIGFLSDMFLRYITITFFFPI